MKVLIPLYAFYPSQLGGPCNTLYWIAKELVFRGMDVVVVASDNGIVDRNIKADYWLDLDGIKIKYCGTKKPKMSMKITLTSLKLVSQSDVLIFSSLCYIPYFFIGILGLFLGKKIIWSPRGELFASAINKSKGKKLYFYILKLLFCQKVIFNATSQEEVDLIYKFFGKKANCVLIPNFMELLPKINVFEKDNYLLYVGRITKIKALDNLIKSLAISEKFRNSDYKLYLAGANNGDYYEELLTIVNEYSLQERIIFKGMITGIEKEKLFAGAKLTLLVSHSENFGNVVIESLAQGTPVLTSQGTPWQELPEYGVGYWIDNSPEVIASAIDAFLSLQPEGYKKMRERSFIYSKEKFDIKSNINKWIEIIN